MENEALQRKVEDAQTEGWSVGSERSDSVVMIKRKYGSLGGHILVAILTCWTLGVGNALYAAYKYFADVDKKVVRAESHDTA